MDDNPTAVAYRNNSNQSLACHTKLGERSRRSVMSEEKTEVRLVDAEMGRDGDTETGRLGVKKILRY